MIITKSNLLIYESASKDKVHRSIHCLHINQDGSTVATNGRVFMLVSPFVQESSISLGPEGVSLGLDFVKRILKSMEGDFTLLNKAGDEVEFVSADFVTENTVSSPPVKALFPMWRELFHRWFRGKKKPIYLDLHLVLQAMQTLNKILPQQAKIVELHLLDNGIIIRAKNPEKNQVIICLITGMVKEGVGGEFRYNVWERKTFMT